MRSWFLPAAMVVLAIISLVMIGSVRSDLLARQALFFLFGGVVYYLSMRIPFARWLRWKWWLYVLVIFLLLLPLLLGHSSRNTSRWIELGFFRLQPSQLAIPLVGLSSVWLLSPAVLTLKRITLFLASLIPPTTLILISPDLGTTVVFLSVLLSLLWFAGTSFKHLLLLVVLGCSVIILSWILILKPYQRERFLSFVVGTQQADQQHYNAAQALIAVGGGEVTGTGWGRGSQAQLLFLPERQTDFIFSSYAQEFGFIGTSLLLGVVVLITIMLFHFARQISDKPASLYILMAGMTLFLQAGVNIGMNIGLLPITGVTLPLVSYGGSSIVATCLLFGVCGSILQRQIAVQPQIIS